LEIPKTIVKHLNNALSVHFANIPVSTLPFQHSLLCFKKNDVSESSPSGTSSKTSSQPCEKLLIGDIAVINGQPCQIYKITEQKKTQKHAKVQLSIEAKTIKDQIPYTISCSSGDHITVLIVDQSVNDRNEQRHPFPRAH
jgi:hypothetical protein